MRTIHACGKKKRNCDTIGMCFLRCLREYSHFLFSRQFFFSIRFFLVTILCLRFSIYGCYFLFSRHLFTFDFLKTCRLKSFENSSGKLENRLQLNFIVPGYTVNTDFPSRVHSIYKNRLHTNNTLMY